MGHQQSLNIGIMQVQSVETKENWSLNQILSALGITKEPSKFQYKYKLFKDGELLGDFSANESWIYLRANNLINF